jgi:outer membrane protein OmpA-like peptidoglycan-associated protein
MKWLFGLLAIVTLNLDVPVSDACGVKLTVKSSPARKAVAHTSNPSEVLLLGDPPSRLKRDLSAAGHHVEVASSPAAASRKDYAVVITDAKLQDDAKQSFPNSIVVVRSGDVDGDVHSLENVVARRPVRTDTRIVENAREARRPIAAGPPQDANHRLTAAKEPKEGEPAPGTEVAAAQPKPAPPEVKATEPKPVEPKPAEPTKPAEPEHIAKSAATTTETAKPALKSDALVAEVYFGLNRAKLGSTAPLDKAAKKLSSDPDAHCVIEGHADPTGTPEGNQVLGQQRAEWVRDYLVGKGIDQSRLDVISYGDTRLKYGKADGRNRRAAIIVK